MRYDLSIWIVFSLAPGGLLSAQMLTTRRRWSDNVSKHLLETDAAAITGATRLLHREQRGECTHHPGRRRTRHLAQPITCSPNYSYA